MAKRKACCEEWLKICEGFAKGEKVQEAFESFIYHFGITNVAKNCPVCGSGIGKKKAKKDKET